MIRLMKICLETILAGLCAVAILCGIFSVYYVTPIHIANEQGNTDYVWPANSAWIKMTEGISWGRFDANGYNNLQVMENPDILILGSSHMEATNIMQDQNLAYRLQEALNDTYQVYNMGISGHHFLKVCKYLPVTLTLYEDMPDVIVIETSDTNFTAKEINQLLEGSVEYTPSHSTGIVAMLQRLPFLRLTYQQLDGGLLDLFMPEDDTPAPAGNSVTWQADEEAYEELFRYIRQSLQGCDSRIIIFYHPTGKLQEDGSIVFQEDEATALFAKKCEEAGITFLNMTDSFLELYNDLHKVPHGFVTGELGEGHLNADGHERIAQELAEIITALEEAELLCK